MTETPARRWLGPAALALFLGLPGLLAATTLANALRWSQAAEAAGERGAQLARLEAKVRGLAAAPAAAPAETASPFLEARSPSLARAELQTRLVALVERAGGRLIEVQVEEEPAAADPLSLLARVTLETRNPGLLDLLTAVENGRPLLTVEGLNLRPAQGHGAQGYGGQGYGGQGYGSQARGAAAEEDPMLRVALAVRGYRAEERP
ncbi:type II secretion system protein GspM [Methylobacterium sp. WSM2598]|uniref:type II secretion system protein GspM n=1 Tax=Methylobacterium sp. WSM2598 TaxID=398261 RepID=UPI000371C53E|nr:type II secretion system protein GspM [Methylobacterium sp. WSM2598]